MKNSVRSVVFAYGVVFGRVQHIFQSFTFGDKKCYSDAHME